MAATTRLKLRASLAASALMLLALGSCDRAAPPPADPALAPRSESGAGIDSIARAELMAADAMDFTMDSLEAAGELNQVRSVAVRQLDLRRLRLGPRHAMVAASLHRLGRIEQLRGCHAVAVSLLEQAVGQRRELFGDRSREVAASLYQLAVAEKSAGRWLSSREHHRESLALRRSLYPDGSPEIAESLNGLANLHRYLEEYPEARRLMRQALDIRRRAFGEDHLDVAESRMDLGLVEIQMGRYTEAERNLRQARAIRRRHLGPNHFELSVTANLLGIALTAQAKLDEAEQTLREAAAIAEQARERAAPGPAKASRYRLTVYNELAAVLLAIGRQDQAWREFERGQARELSEALIPHPPSAFEPFSLERVQRALDPGTAILGWLDISPGVGEPHSAWGYVIRNRGPVHWVRLAPRGVTLGPAVTGHAPHLMQLISSAAAWPLPVVEIGEVKREGARLWAERVQPMMAFLDQVEELVVVASPAFHGAIGPMVTSDGTWMADRYAISYSPSATLFAWWSEKRAGAGAPSPLALLIGDPPFSDRHLADMTESSSRSATRIEPAVARPSARTAMTQPASVDTLLARLPRLPGSRWELEQLLEVFPNAILLEGPRAAEPELYRLAREGRLGQFGTIHVASHVVSRGAWDEWAIVLAQVGPWARPASRVSAEVDDGSGDGAPISRNNPADGLLTGPEIRDSLLLHCDLVTLSGCLSAGGATGYAAGALGVGNAFLYAGARTILVSMWHADDQAIARFMARFYENRSGAYSEDRGQGPGIAMRKVVALQEANRWLLEWRTPDGRQPYRHPAYWSGFILIGDPG